MKKIIFTLTILLVFNFQFFGQINPVNNLTWDQNYVFTHNFFQLDWDEPTLPHSELIGYNIYRENELYRFQTETTLYNFYSDVYGYVSNCSEEFLLYINPNQPNNYEFDIHVTAVYNPGQTESNYLQTVHCYGLALNKNNFNREKAQLFPNPTNGIINIGNINLEKIIIYDISGKEVKEFLPKSQIDLDNLSKGLYFIKLFSERGIIIDKIVIK